MARMTTPAEDTLTALIHLLDREGYDAVTADQLAREAGMSRASFFRHLGGKEEVVFADHAALLARLDDFLRGTSLGVREALEEAVFQVFRHHTADPDRARARSRLLRGSQSLRTRELLTSHRYTELFSGWLASALPDTPARGGVAVGLAAAVVAVHNRALRAWLHAPADDAEAGLRADLAEVIARLTAEPAEAERTLAAVRRLLD